jgi:hypothetical protein
MSGKHWYIALLEAIGLWTDDNEEQGGRSFNYLIGNEAFDWLVLAERLCDEVNGLVPDPERFELLFRGKPPLELSAEQFQSLIGDRKYRQHLNFFYGITVEEALNLAVRDEIRKERRASGLGIRRDETDEVFRRIYGTTESQMLQFFRTARDTEQPDSLSLTELKEFIYYRFKYRVRESEKARVASDTQKALFWLQKNGFRWKIAAV